MSRKRLRKSDVRTLSEELPIDLDKKMVVEQEEDKLFVNDELWFCTLSPHDGWVPSLRLLLRKPDLLASVVVDMGAVRFVTRGADIMRPGITKIEDFEKDDLVVVVDETHQKPLAIGKALVSADVMRTAKEGRVIQNLRYVGDELWG